MSPLSLSTLATRLRLPLIAAPMFIVSTPQMVVAQCVNGVVGSFPALNARGEGELAQWLTHIHNALEAAKIAAPCAYPVAPYAVNLIVHASNPRLQADLALCVQHRVPLVITSLGAAREVVEAVHSYGGVVLHDVITARHAQKALEHGVDGLILVCAGAGGHGGTYNPLAFVAEVRQFYKGPLALSGCISNGAGILAARAMGADFAYMGTRFIATTEAHASMAYKECIVHSNAADIVYTPHFTGVAGNYLRASIEAAGLDPAELAAQAGNKPNLFLLQKNQTKAWRDIWGAGQGVGGIREVLPMDQLLDELARDYHAAYQALGLG